MQGEMRTQTTAKYIEVQDSFDIDEVSFGVNISNKIQIIQLLMLFSFLLIYICEAINRYKDWKVLKRNIFQYVVPIFVIWK